VAKLGVFAAAVDGGGPGGVALALIGVLTSVVSVYYYLRVAYVMYAGQPAGGTGAHPGDSPQPAGGTGAHPGDGPQPPGGSVRLHPSPLLNLALLILAAVVIQTGVLPAAVTAFAQQATAVLR
jgi:NADH:ubiquinone oxidoreductase subunit 2 (subunit N)